MIELTRLNGQQLIVNALYIEQIEELPDTILTLTNGKKLVVREAGSEVKQKAAGFYAGIAVFGQRNDVEG
ncbi:flagellar FlbD family protein [Bacillus marinisedimentorum]|uniref:flagellar FlbD family protein n=1 Tax=Bacillus marinisedimentorum TaxID=1821260 RepID=UPI0007E07728|nr:flagellar FlbD family protein [Bacillus marinisedimentorum]